MSRDRDVAAIAAQIEGLLDDLRSNVAALAAVLAPPDPPAGYQEASP